MRHFFYLTLVSLLSVTVAQAAETGTYRPGQVYLSVSAQHPNQCAQQCMGDALCKGWNFVRVRPAQNQSICEFNARKVSPIPSAISISGDNPTARASERLVPAGYRTLRVGTPERKIRRPSTNTVRVGFVPSPNTASVKMTAPTNAVPSPNTQRAAAPAPKLQYQNQSQRTLPVLRHSLDAKPQSVLQAAPRLASRPVLPIAPRPVDQSISPLVRQQTVRLPAAPVQPSIQNSEITAPTPIEISTELPEPRPAIAMAAPIPAPQIDSDLVGAPVSVERAQRSLFGSLYDDVKAPQSLTAQDIPLDPDAPIPTVTSVPVAKIDQSRLN